MNKQCYQESAAISVREVALIPRVKRKDKRQTSVTSACLPAARPKQYGTEVLSCQERKFLNIIALGAFPQGELGWI